MPSRMVELCGATPGSHLTMRVVGLPGETIEVRRGVATVNGEVLDEPYVAADARGGPDYGPDRVPEGHYFVMGDERYATCDSRVWGAVPPDRLVGEVTDG